MKNGTCRERPPESTNAERAHVNPKGSFSRYGLLVAGAMLAVSPGCGKSGTNPDAGKPDAMVAEAGRTSSRSSPRETNVKNMDAAELGEMNGGADVDWERVRSLFGPRSEQNRRTQLIQSPEYGEASARLGGLLSRLEGASKEEATKVRDEMDAYLEGLRISNRDVYDAFHESIKEIYEKVHFIITGERITIE